MTMNNTSPKIDTNTNHNTALDAWIDAHFDEEVQFLQQLVRVPTDTPPGNNAPHAERTAELLQDFGFEVEKHPVPAQEVKDYGMESITNLVVRRKYGEGRTIALNAHGDVVPPGDSWTHDPYGAEVVDGKLYGRASAVSKSDFATYTFAVRALEALGLPLKGGVELLFTYDEEFGGELGPGWLLRNKLTQPDFLIAAGFAYEWKSPCTARWRMRPFPTPASTRCRAPRPSSTRCTSKTSCTSRSPQASRASSILTSMSGASKAARTPTWCPARSSSSWTAA
jgi:hypothetical protein